MLWKRSPLVLLLALNLLGQLLWSPSYSIGQAILMLLLGLSYAEFAVYCCVLLLDMARRRTIAALLTSLLLVALLLLNLSIMILPLVPAVRLIAAMFMIFLQYGAAYRTSHFAWPPLMVASSAAKSSEKQYILSRYPSLRKEIYFFTRFKDMFPIIIIVCVLQLFTYYSAVDNPVVIPIGAALMVWLVSSIAMLKTFINEGRGLTLYSVTLRAWRKLLYTKWLFYGAIGIGTYIIHTLVWQFRLGWPWTEESIPILGVQGLLFTATLISFSLLAGYHFTVEGRISLPAQLLIIICIFLLIYLQQAFLTLFILISAAVHLGLYRLYSRVPSSLVFKY